MRAEAKPSRTHRRRWALAALFAAACSLVMVAVALAAPGGLTPRGCIDDNDTGADICAASADGLDGAAGVAVSPDGESLYIASFADNTIARFDRDPATGALTAQGCIEDNDTGPDGCAASTDGLGGAADVVVSSDGESVYVASGADDAIVSFDRDPATGALTAQGCIDDNDTGADTCAATADGLDGPNWMALSPDGESVYTSSAVDSAIARFDRDPATGALTAQGCIDDNDTGPDACAASADGLGATNGVAVSPDGESAYAASGSDDAIVRFDRAPATGALTAQGCIDDNDTGPETCAASADGLDRTQGVAVSPDRRSVYVASDLDDAIARFDRDPATGALTAQGCIDDNDTGADACAASANGLDGVFVVAASPDGESVYFASAGDDAIARFDRDPATGALTAQGCIDDNDTGADTCAASTDGLDDAAGVVVSPDRKSLYVAGIADDAITRFDRERGEPQAPDTEITFGPSGFTNDPDPFFEFSADEAGSTFRCAIGPPDDVGFHGTCSGIGFHTPASPLADGTWTFSVVAVDQQGNVDLTPATSTFTVDTAAPPAPSLGPVSPASPANDNSPTFKGLAEEGSTVSIHPTAGCAGTPIATLSAFALATTGFTGAVAPNTTNNFRARATDGAGNVSPCSAALTYVEDSAAPNTTISGPARTRKRSPSFTLGSSESGSTFQCKLDAGAFAPCTSPFKRRLRPGKHTIQVRATDRAGNTDSSPAVKTVRVRRS